VVGGKGLEQFDQVAGGVPDQDLPDPHPGDDVVAEACGLAAQLLDNGTQALDLQGDPVPAARLGQLAPVTPPRRPPGVTFGRRTGPPAGWPAGRLATSGPAW